MPPPVTPGDIKLATAERDQVFAEYAAAQIAVNAAFDRLQAAQAAVDGARDAFVNEALKAVP